MKRQAGLRPIFGTCIFKVYLFFIKGRHMRLQIVLAVWLLLASSWPPAAFAHQSSGPATLQNQAEALLLTEIAKVRQKAEQ